jgi:hypothetical protein
MNKKGEKGTGKTALLNKSNGIEWKYVKKGDRVED